MQTSLLVSVSEQRLTELIADAVASALRDKAPQHHPPPDTNSGPLYITRKELLAELQIAPSTLAAWQRQGYITPRRIGRRVYFLRREVDAILSAGDQDWRAGR